MKQNIYDNPEFFQKYKAIRERANNYNNLLEQPNFLCLMPDVKDKMVLDIGCGMGDFAASCLQKGAAQVKGIDISKNMIDLAKSKHVYPQLQFQHIAFLLQKSGNRFRVMSFLTIFDCTINLEKINESVEI